MNANLAKRKNCMKARKLILVLIILKVLKFTSTLF